MTRDFQLRKAYASGAQTVYRAITKPVAGSVLAGVGQTALTLGDDYTVDTTTGIVTFTRPPDVGAEVRAGSNSTCRCGSTADLVQVSVASFKAGSLPSVPVLEVRL